VECSGTIAASDCALLLGPWPSYAARPSPLQAEDWGAVTRLAGWRSGQDRSTLPLHHSPRTGAASGAPDGSTRPRPCSGRTAPWVQIWDGSRIGTNRGAWAIVVNSAFFTFTLLGPQAAGQLIVVGLGEAQAGDVAVLRSARCSDPPKGSGSL